MDWTSPQDAAGSLDSAESPARVAPDDAEHAARALARESRRVDPPHRQAGPRRAPPASRVQRVRHRVRGHLHRPAHRLRHVGDVRRSVERTDARGRVVRRRPELLPLRGHDPFDLRLPARDPDAPGPRRGEPAVLDGPPAGRGRSEQHPLRHDAGQRRGQRRRRRGPGDSRGPRSSRPPPLQGQHGPRAPRGLSLGERRQGPARHADADEQLGRRSARVARERPGGERALPEVRRPAHHRRVPLRRERLVHQAARGGSDGPVGRRDRARGVRPLATAAR